MARKGEVRVSTRERLAIVEEAIRLIRKPISWTQGDWQCVVDHDRRGDPVFAYCLDGAIGAAAVTVLGGKRAKALGVDLHPDNGYVRDGGYVAEWLSIRRLAYDALVERGVFDDADDPYDDDDSYQITFNDSGHTTHKDVLDLLRKKARELRAAVKRLDVRRAGA